MTIHGALLERVDLGGLSLSTRARSRAKASAIAPPIAPPTP
jgi:hypothetical protein